MSTLYHLRHPNGTSVDMTNAPRHSVLETARKEQVEVYEVRGSIATRIYSPPSIKPVNLEQ